MFSTYKEVVGGHLYMRNSSTFKVLGVVKVILKMTLKKFQTLNNMLCVIDIKINLMYGSLLRKNGFKLSLRVTNLYSLKIKC
jgi:hypothetical protein